MKPIRLLAAGAALVAAALVASCAQEPTTPALEQAPAPLLGTLTGTVGAVLQPLTGSVSATYLSCSVRPERADTLTMGHAGGSAVVDYATLVVPRGALARGTSRTFVMRTPSDSIASVIFTPIDGEGEMRFERPVTLQLGYRHCVPRTKAPKKIVYTTDLVDVVTGLPAMLLDLGGLDDASHKQVRATTDHFSRYAIAW